MRDETYLSPYVVTVNSDSTHLEQNPGTKNEAFCMALMLQKLACPDVGHPKVCATLPPAIRLG